MSQRVCLVSIVTDVARLLSAMAANLHMCERACPFLHIPGSVHCHRLFLSLSLMDAQGGPIASPIGTFLTSLGREGLFVCALAICLWPPIDGLFIG